MSARKLYVEDGLDLLRDEMVYTEGRLLFDENAKDQAEPVIALIKDIERVRQGQLDCWRAETHAQSHIDAINYRHDKRTARLEAKLQVANLDHPQGKERQSRYFPIAPSKIIALGLRSQFKYTRGYGPSLANEPEDELRELSPGFSEDIIRGDQALAAQDAAAVARKDHRVREIAKVFANANNTRRDVHAALSGRITALGLSPDWADGFFRSEKRNAPASNEPTNRQRAAIVAIFEARDLELNSAQRDALNDQEDLATLTLWMQRAVTLTVEETFATAKESDR
jgi:hypothetical protein